MRVQATILGAVVIAAIAIYFTLISPSKEGMGSEGTAVADVSNSASRPAGIQLEGKPEAEGTDQRTAPPASQSQPQELKAKPEPLYGEEWVGTPGGALVSSHWGTPEEDIRAELEQTWPQLVQFLDRPVQQPLPHQSVAAEEVLQLAYSGAEQNIEQLDRYAFQRAVGKSESSFLDSVTKRAADAGLQNVTRDSLRAEFAHHLSRVEQCGIAFENAKAAAMASMVRSGKYDAFPLVTIPSKRSFHQRDSDNAAFIDLISADSNGWVIQINLFTGDDPVLDQAFSDLQQAGQELNSSIDQNLGL
jgi:hypothetical protein